MPRRSRSGLLQHLLDRRGAHRQRGRPWGTSRRTRGSRCRSAAGGQSAPPAWSRCPPAPREARPAPPRRRSHRPAGAPPARPSCGDLRRRLLPRQVDGGVRLGRDLGDPGVDQLLELRLVLFAKRGALLRDQELLAAVLDHEVGRRLAAQRSLDPFRELLGRRPPAPGGAASAAAWSDWSSVWLASYSSSSIRASVLRTYSSDCSAAAWRSSLIRSLRSGSSSASSLVRASSSIWVTM